MFACQRNKCKLHLTLCYWLKHRNYETIIFYCNEVDIDEDDIKDYYDTRYLTANVIASLSESLHNVYIDYYEDEDDDYCLDGCLENYI